MKCSNCTYSDTIRYGVVRSKQRYFCYSCGYQFTKTKTDDFEIAMAISLWESGLSRRVVGLLLGVNEVTIYRWEKKYGNDDSYKVYLDDQVAFLETKSEYFQSNPPKFNRLIRKLKKQADKEWEEFKKTNKYF